MNLSSWLALDDLPFDVVMLGDVEGTLMPGTLLVHVFTWKPTANQLVCANVHIWTVANFEFLSTSQWALFIWLPFQIDYPLGGVGV